MIEAPKILDPIHAGTADRLLFNLDAGALMAQIGDAEIDALITDPPYGDRTHAGQARSRSDGREGFGDGREGFGDLGYASISAAFAAQLAAEFARVCKGWIVVFSCSDLAHVWRRAFDDLGLCSFAPVIDYSPGSRVRLQGDGPSNWATYINVARPRGRLFSTWGTLPGGYQSAPDKGPGRRKGGKPIGLMRQIVKDYTRAGDLILDPFCGHGTTGAAAVAEGRRFVGCDIDAAAVEVSRQRLNAGGVRIEGQGELFK